MTPKQAMAITIKIEVNRTSLTRLITENIGKRLVFDSYDLEMLGRWAHGVSAAVLAETERRIREDNQP